MTDTSKRDNDRKNTEHSDDASYVLMCQKGNTDSFRVLVERHQKKMLNIAYRITGDYEEACDAVQEAFFSAFKAIKKFRGEATFSTWLTRITMNHARNRLTKIRSFSHHVAPSINDPVETETGQVLFDPPTQEEPILAQIEKKELQAKVQECINTLDEDFKEVLILRDIQEFSYDEIRDILDIPEGTIKSRLFRAREFMRNCLKHKLGDIT